MCEKCIRGGLCLTEHSYEKAKNKYLKGYDPNPELWHVLACQQSICTGNAMKNECRCFQMGK